MIQLVYWEIWETCFESEMVEIIAKTHSTQRKIVQYTGTSVSLNSVEITDWYEYGTIACLLRAHINCDVTIFRIVGVDWIDRKIFVIILIVENFYILFFNQFENKMTSYLLYSISQLGCITCPGCASVF